jgi:crotonobetainyl-CoA:carnitine CoA-transferase CaiB-like acyl-CoA transferase
VDDGRRPSLCEATGRQDLAADQRLATAAGRRTEDRRLWSVFEDVFTTRSASEWFVLLDSAGAHASSATRMSRSAYSTTPRLVERRWVVGYAQGLVGHLEQLALLFDFSGTPARIAGPLLVRSPLAQTEHVSFRWAWASSR